MRDPDKPQQIIEAAVRVFARRGYFNARVSDIAREAGIAAGTIYLYFDTKEDILVTLFREKMAAFVEAVRRYLASLPPSESGWLAGLRDAVIGQALTAIHNDVRRAWTVEDLARAVGVSRSVFADRFTTMVGHPPMQYLALWRMQLASRRLLEGGHVAAVAAEVGYESEAAFSRAFKKIVGEAPATWRNKVKAGTA